MTLNPLVPLLAILQTALPALPAPPAPSTWQWPLEPPVRIVRPFAPPSAPWLPGHRGIDLAAQPRQHVFSVGPGTVTFARDLAGRGVITVTHGLLRTTYQPVEPLVARGRRVSPGDLLGEVEALYGHCGPDLCLHWGLRRGPTYLNPLSLVAPPVIRLLPHWDLPLVLQRQVHKIVRGAAGQRRESGAVKAPPGAAHARGWAWT